MAITHSAFSAFTPLSGEVASPATSLDSSSSGVIEDQDKSDGVLMRVRELKATARAAILEFRSVHESTRAFFQGIHEDKLTDYQRPRILGLVAQANAVGDIPMMRLQDNICDFIRVIECCKRKSEWLLSIIIQCQAVLSYENHLYAGPSF
jgi:hypothetical protein